MRGTDERTGSLFSYVDLEARVRKDHPLRVIRGLVNEALDTMASDFASALCGHGPPLDRAGEAASGDAAAGLLFDTLGAATDGTVGVRSSIPLVRRSGHRRSGVGSFNLLEEPRSALGRRCRRPVPVGASASAARQAAVVHRSLQRRWHAVRGLGLDEELQADRRGPNDPVAASRPAAISRRDFRGETRSNATHASTTDPEARLYRKGPGMEARLAFLGHALMENRSRAPR